MLFAVLLLLAQFTQVDTGELRVRVADAGGLPLASVVDVLSEATQVHAQYQTDANGIAVARRLPFGTYRVTVSRDAFTTYSGVVQIRSARPVELPVTLSLAPVESAVTVRAGDTLVDTHQTTTVQHLGTDAIRSQPLALPGRSLPDLVDTQPGWLMEANGVLHPRGSEYQTQYVIDGLPLTDNRSPAFAPAIDSAAVESMAIRTGGYPAEYGRKLGGVVEVVTASEQRRGFHGSAVASLGTFATRGGDATGGYAWSRGSVSVSGGIAATDRYLDPPVEQNFTNHGTTHDVAARLEQELSSADRFGVIFRSGATSFLVPNEFVQQQAGQRQDRANGETAGLFSYQHLFASSMTADVRGMARAVSATLTSNDGSVPVIVDQDRGFHELYVKASIGGLRHGHEWKAGGDLSAARVREQFGFAVTNPDAFDPDVPPAFAFSGRGDDREAAFFAQDQMALGRWTLNAGLRWDSYRFLVHDHAFSPRVSAAWSPSADLVFRASYDRAFQTPAVENLLLASSPDVDTLRASVVHLPVPPSRGNFYEAGVSKAVRAMLRVDASYFHRSVHNFADDDVLLNTGVNFPIAFAQATVDGVDIKAELPTIRRFTASAAYSWMKGTATLPVTGGLFLDDDASLLLSSRDTFPITQDQRHTVRARGSYHVTTQAWAALAASYGSGLPFEFAGTAGDALAQYGSRIVDRVNFDTGRVRPRFSLDASVGATLNRSSSHVVRLQVDVRNLTNRLDVINFAGLFSGTALAPPRTVGVRLSAGF